MPQRSLSVVGMASSRRTDILLKTPPRVQYDSGSPAATGPSPLRTRRSQRSSADGPRRPEPEEVVAERRLIPVAKGGPHVHRKIDECTTPQQTAIIILNTFNISNIF